jgi:PilZ domain
MNEKRGSERILLKFPIRVSAFGEGTGSFTEETHTVEVNRVGARIALQHRVAANDTIRIANLENLREADFRVVGPIHLDDQGIPEWGVECLEPDHNVWDIQFASPLDTHESPAGALLVCGDCGAQSFCNLQDWEYEVLKSGPLQRFCSQCGEPTKWQYADVSRRVEESDHHELPPPTPPPGPVRPAELPPDQWVGRREHKRLALKLPTLIRDATGREEVTKSENLSKGGLAVGLGMMLEVGDIVSVYCPYSEGGQNLEQKAEVRNRRTFFAGERWIYGLRYVM